MTYNHGCIVHLSLKNFMQYVEISVRPGPSLNVVLGPNGSGKSALVNGIALALGAKTSVLGRADSLSEFICYGAESAETEIELHNAFHEGENFVIKRSWGKDSKSIWQLNGRRATGKDIQKLVDSLNIQTDNLCQFLPQDKVYDFSKLNPRELLGKTVAAFGEPELKADHEMLKYLVEDLSKKEEESANRLKILSEKKNRYNELEIIMKTMTDKDNINAKLKLLNLKRDWSRCLELKGNLEVHEARRDKQLQKIDASNQKGLVLAQRIKELRAEKNLSESSAQKDIMKSRDLLSKVNLKQKKVSSIGDELENLAEGFRQRQAQEKTKEAQLQTIKQEIANLRSEIEESNDSVDLENQVDKINFELQNLHTEKGQFDEQVRSKNHERCSLEATIRRLKDHRTKLLDVEFHKKENLRKLSPQGRDILIAMDWIENNREKLVGEVFNPICLLIDVFNKDNSKLIENCIPLKDLTAFGVNSSEDAHLLINQFRKVMKINFNLIVYKTNPDPNRFQTSQSHISKDLDLKGFIKDMFSTSLPVMDYLCEMYQLHNTPVFGPKASDQISHIVDELKFRTFFVEDWIHVVRFSEYTRKSMISSRRIDPRNLLGSAVDKNQLQYVENQIEETQQKCAIIMDTLKAANGNMKAVDRAIEKFNLELKELKQRLSHKRVLKGRLSAKESQVENLESQLKPDELKKAHQKMVKQQHEKLLETVVVIKSMKNLVIEANNLRILADICKLKASKAQDIVDGLKVKQDAHDTKISELQIALGEEEENLKIAKADYERHLSEVQKMTGHQWKGTDPPPKVTKSFIEEGINDLGLDEVKIRINELEGQLECLEDVDPSLSREFKELKNNLVVLEGQTSELQSSLLAKQGQMNEVKNRWLTRMETLIQQVNSKFSLFFAKMGYAGEVNLLRGTHDDDFANYGIAILVKFRENMPLQQLDPFRQSGGERSVSTALYMMALQSLTKVPFRCVDEINQGMDATNERKVFDMLMKTSVQDHQAQYFLLTPKLLPDLHYDEGVTVLIVHHGQHLCHFTEWSMKNFLAA